MDMFYSIVDASESLLGFVNSRSFPRRGVMYLTISLSLWYNIFGIVYPGSTLVRIRTIYYVHFYC
jgi:hypothetical protein